MTQSTSRRSNIPSRYSFSFRKDLIMGFSSLVFAETPSDNLPCDHLVFSLIKVTIECISPFIQLTALITSIFDDKRKFWPASKLGTLAQAQRPPRKADSEVAWIIITRSAEKSQLDTVSGVIEKRKVSREISPLPTPSGDAAGEFESRGRESREQSGSKVEGRNNIQYSVS